MSGAVLVVRISANSSLDTSRDGLENEVVTLEFPSLDLALKHIQQENGCSHLLYSSFAEELGFSGLQLWINMEKAKRPKATCESCDCGEAGAVAKQDDVNSAAVVLTKDCTFGASAFDPSASGATKELRGPAFAILPSPSSDDESAGGAKRTTSVVLTANRLRGMLVFLKEVLPYFSSSSGMPKAERDEVIREEIQNFKEGLWEPQETTIDFDMYERDVPKDVSKM
ncbi:unnamed protein product [Amoebophrya sp. A25]|nr:unnamed protein product [Amoebophrya sp. A25]|eukprot:GSA25T00022606001.1